MNIRGYTLLEVSLFLAISGALTLVAIVALAPRLNNVRFTSNMRGLHDNVTREFLNAEGGTSRALEGSCSRGANQITIGTSNEASGSRAECVLVGKLATVEQDSIRYRNIVAAYDPVACSEDPDTFNGVRRCNLATVIDEGESFYSYPGGLVLTSGEGESIGYVRSPNGNSLSRFSLIGATTDDIALSTATSAELSVNSGTVPVCFEQGSRQAHLLFSLNASKVDLNFNEDCP